MAGDVETQDLDKRQPVGDTGPYGVVQVAEGREQPGEGLVVRLAPGDRGEHELDSADGQLLRLAHEMVRYALRLRNSP